MDLSNSQTPQDSPAVSVVTEPATRGSTVTSQLGTPVNAPSNLGKRDEVLASIGRSGLVVVVGAGVSMQSVGSMAPFAEVAGWLGLLNHGVAHCLQHQLLDAEEAEIVRQQIKNGTKTGKTDCLIEAAQRIHDSLDKRTNGRYWWLHDSIGQLQVKDSRLIRAIQGLGALITTLNYDSLLEQVTNWRPIDWSQRVAITRCMHDRERDLILHLHGYWKEPDSIILDRMSYERIKSDDDTCDLLRNFARNYTILFIGCGDTFFDPNFQTLLSWASKALQGVQHRHYVLCRQTDEPKLFTSLQPHGYLDSLVYGAHYDDLSQFLEVLGKASGESAAATNPPVAPTANTSVSTRLLKPADIWNRQSQR